MKVLFLTNIPSPYRVDFFNELGKLCELTVLFERTTSAERDDSWKSFRAEHFQGIVLKGKKRGVDSAFCPGVIKYLKKKAYDRIIVANFTYPTGMLAISWLRMKKIPYYLESDGGFAKDGVGFKEKLKRYFIKGAVGYFSTAKEHDNYYLQYGAREERIKRYPFTSLQKEDILPNPVSAEEKAALREKLGMAEGRIILSVGQFIPRKGFDILLDAIAKLPKNIGCYIVGGEPSGEYLEQAERLGLKNVHFVGFKQKEFLNQYYMAADLFVLPTREDIWGLVVNEAMAKGLPVVTTDRCIAGLELVENGVNGYIVPVDDASALADAIDQGFGLEPRKSLEKIRQYTVEQMAQKHMDILQEGF